MSESSSLLQAVKEVTMLSVIANKTKRLKQQTFFILVKVFILVKQIRLLILKIKVYVHRVNTGNNGILHQANEKEKGTPVDFSVNIALEYLRTYFYMFVLFRLFFLDRFFRGNSEVFFISVAEVFYIFQSDHFRYGADRIFPTF